MTCETEQIVEFCLQEAMAEEQERRGLHRKPFLRQAAITPSLEPEAKYPAFCRDLSRTGIGLLHEQSLEVGDAFTLTIPLLGYQLELQCTTQWCKCLGERRYLSGNDYRCSLTPTSLFLLSAVLSDNLNRRLHRRYPLFRPAVLEQANGWKTAAFTRDVSRHGIGFVHRDPVTPGYVSVMIESSTGEEVTAPVVLERCVALGPDWYSSGGRFEVESASEEQLSDL